jgi:hypothetical protein
MPVTEGIVVPITVDNQLSSGMDRAKRSVESFGNTMSVAGSNAGKFKLSLQDLENKLSLLKEGFKNATDPDVLRRLDSQIQVTTAQVKAQTTAYAKLGVTSAVAAGAATNAFQMAYTGLRNLAMVLPGIGIAGVFNLAFTALAGLVSKNKEANKELEKYNDLIKSTRQESEKEVTTLKALVSVAQNHSLSIEKRMIAVKQLQDQYPGYLKNMSAEEILNGNLSKTTDLLTAAIYKRAAARALETQITEKATQVFLNQQKIEKLNLDIAKAKKEAAESNTAIISTEGGIDLSKSIVYGEQAMKLTAERTRLNIDNMRLTNDINGLQKQGNSILAETIDLEYKDTKAKKEKPEKLEKKGLKRVDQLTIDTPGRQAKGVQMLEMTYDSLGRTIKDNGTIITKASMDAARATQIQFNKTLELKYALESIGSVIVPEMAGAFQNMFQTMAQTGKLSIGSLIGDIGNMIARLLAAAAAAALLGALLQASGLGTILGVAGADKGFAGLFKSIFGGSTGIHLASGGITNGPTRALIGEGKEREVVTPLSQLKNIIGNAGGNMSLPKPELFAKGNDLWIRWVSAQRQNQRSY